VLRLVCLPHAGGNASFFRTWAEQLPSTFELLAVRYPDREDRLLEPEAERLDELADRIAGALVPYVDVPVALFGHSMGAAVAYEVAVRLEERQGVSPVHLFVSGKQAPNLPDRRPVPDRSEQGLINEVRILGGFGMSAMDNPGTRELAVSALRADYALLDTNAS
jgi:pyochelin biosynthetic protein PchC